MLRLLVASLCLMFVACAGSEDGPRQRGQPCSSDEGCGSLACIVDAQMAADDLAALPLLCGDLDARRGRPGESCEEGADCDNGICLLAGACARSCADEADCSALQRCQEVYARTAPDALQSTSACVAMVDLPADVDVDVQTHKDAIEDGSFDFELAATKARATTLYVLEHLDPDWPGSKCFPPLCVRSLRGASSEVLFDRNLDYSQADAPRNPVAFGDHIDPAVIMLPIGDASQPTEEALAVSMQSEQAGDLRVTRLVRSEQGARLDLNLFYVGATDIEPEGARGPVLIAEALDIVDEIFAQADITIGDVRQIAVRGQLPMRGVAFPEGDAQQGFAIIEQRFGVYIELPYLFRLSAGAANTAINLFFVADLAVRGSDGEPQAEAGGIPGPLGMHGLGGSGIAIALDMMAGDPRGLGRTLAHELGHYLGLFHTSEASGHVLDALDDTKECRPEHDLDGDGLSIADCQGLGTDNLMFWAKGTGTTLTPDQRAVLQRALVLQ